MKNQLIDKLLGNRPFMTALALAGGVGAYLSIVIGGYVTFLAIVAIGT